MKWLSYIKKGEWAKLYSLLKSQNYTFSMEELLDTFSDSNIGFQQFYSFLMYVMCKEESVDFHISICKMLLYSDWEIDDVYSIIRWHAFQGIRLEDGNVKMECYILDEYCDIQSPFTDEELLSFAEKVIIFYPNDYSSNNFMKNYKNR